MSNIENIELDVSKLQCFGDSNNSAFYLLTDSKLEKFFNLFDVEEKYSELKIIPINPNANFEKLFSETIKQNSHVLVISPENYFKSPDPKILTNTRKLAVLACFSTPTTTDMIRHFIKEAQNTESSNQTKFTNYFFEVGEKSTYLKLVDKNYGTEAVFNHLSDSLVWHEQMGILDWGEQQLFPSGEISTLPVSVYGQDINSTLNINGTISLHGIPILHSGSPSFLAEDQQRIYNDLSVLQNSPVIAHVHNGTIVELKESNEESILAKEMLNAMFNVDSRFAVVIEMGFGINTNLTLYQGNCAMNEVYGGTNGAVHIGLGLIPHTQYHLDIICPNIEVLNDQGKTFFGGNNSKTLFKKKT